MSKHTPGPWVFASAWPAEWDAPYRNDSQTSSVTAVADSDGNVVAMSVMAYDEWSNPTKDAERTANARLIAAAPELLKACLYAIRAGDLHGLELKPVREAISKATGVEQ